MSSSSLCWFLRFRPRPHSEVGWAQRSVAAKKQITSARCFLFLPAARRVWKPSRWTFLELRSDGSLSTFPLFNLQETRLHFSNIMATFGFFRVFQ
jgi:hypothetical protein